MLRLWGVLYTGCIVGPRNPLYVSKLIIQPVDLEGCLWIQLKALSVYLSACPTVTQWLVELSVCACIWHHNSPFLFCDLDRCELNMKVYLCFSFFTSSFHLWCEFMVCSSTLTWIYMGDIIWNRRTEWVLF